jgi:predicted PurR-regulated permease PerM
MSMQHAYEALEEIRTVSSNIFHTIADALKRQNLSEPLSRLLSRSSASLIAIMSQLFVAATTGFTYAFSLTVNVLMFGLTLYYLLLNQHSPIHHASRLLVLVDPRERIRIALEASLKAIVLSTFKLAAFHFVFTWLTFHLFSMQFTYMASFVSALVAVMPVISPFWVVVPACMQLVVVDHVWSAIILLVLHIGAVRSCCVCVMKELGSGFGDLRGNS